MSTALTPEDSLFRLVDRVATHLEPVSVQSHGLKAILQSWLGFLAAQSEAAIIWTKLPRGRGWQELLSQYGHAQPRSHLYCLDRPRQEGGNRPQVAPPQLRLPLPDRRLWRGEYLLLFCLPSGSGVLLAQRHPPASQRGPQAGEATAAQRVELRVVSSLQPTVVSEVRAALQQMLYTCLQTYPDHVEWTDLLSHWETVCPPPASSTNLAWLDQFLCWQWQKQAQLGHQVSRYRRQAQSATDLSRQNESLMSQLQLREEFCHAIGQELRTPLANIKMALSLLTSSKLPPQQQQRYLTLISHECDRQSSVINGVLDLLQIEVNARQVTPAPSRLIETVPAVISTYQPLAEEKGIRLTCTITDDLPSLACPEAWLRQIMIHLVHNSIKYTPSGGEAWVAAQQRQADRVEVVIQDTGQGIAPNEVPKIFDHFYQGRQQPPDQPEGAGLGLTIVQQLLTHCGGTITVNSHPGKGTTFRVYFPTHEEPEQ
ncbi:Sensor histidine kinase [Halomicronema hongdechloris C2206]|uniref:histidine kinase n=1 Tax=Halomicronema hongdechloris C2206 TaxID=1641165 RepID=A0A1Z3HPQ7_9CYAN|nr:ATP-binding protein [Halomicronema hongdechloris]ASC72290.1 Sensor histidine kinase [Halomicronema hongdechloris C2206]